ncbi:hypothetical protein A5893_13105 [Pedobacter psychrophilus]|uniref:Uncharacterized protein n=1 Tax=Pedobacter psychrophilus TaxID=1826909 RepID=A0A179DE44_9SPHI|nr:hypothetical protein [Pedobacter psychrophilus]OAQ38970.1 hypothetical protein A5893_13105 [Pedobacter psychrophilus]
MQKQQFNPKTVCFWFLAFSFLLTTGMQCKKDKSDTIGLPAVTQEGKNTLGFLLNGEAWTPKGFNGTANLSIYYDEGFRGGVFNISAYRLFGDNSDLRERITIASDSVQTPQKITFGKKNFTVVYRNENCDFGNNNNSSLEGYCEITKIDKINKVFSGVFEFKFTKQGCEPINITQGRFDMKY